MKKIVGSMLVVFALMFLLSGVSQASTYRLGTDVFGCEWWAEYIESGVSKNGVAYDSIAIIIFIADNPQARTYYNVGTNIAMVGYLRYIDCTGRRWANVHTMSWDYDEDIVYDSGVNDTWTWMDCAAGTMMDKVLRVFCGAWK